MTFADWRRVIDQAADMSVRDVQFIGGEPTLYTGLSELVRYALDQGLNVEIYSNLVTVRPDMWQLFLLPGVHLATSYYGADAAAHNAVTGRPSHRRTRANIRKAVELGIPLRVAVIDVGDSQTADEAMTELRQLGVEDVGLDSVRQIGRGRRGGGQDIGPLCGRCGDGRLAILPSGAVTPCTLSRWMEIGNVHEMALADVFANTTAARQVLQAEFGKPKPPPPKPPKPDNPPCQAPLRCPPSVGPKR